MNNKFLQTGFVAVFVAVFMGCSSFTPRSDLRNPASGGTGDIGSSNNNAEKFESFKLPITRNSKKETRVAYNSWSGEYPNPVIDVHSDNVNGLTTIVGYGNLRNPTEADKQTCTIKNGVYHPWSKNDPSSITYYTIASADDYQVLKTVDHKIYDSAGKSKIMKIPAGAQFVNVIYYGENYCGSIYQIGKTKRPFSESCDFFAESKNMKKLTSQSDFSEQWLYLSCEEKDETGKNKTVFVKDTELLSQPGIIQGCPDIDHYGSVKGANGCKAD